MVFGRGFDSHRLHQIQKAAFGQPFVFNECVREKFPVRQIGRIADLDGLQAARRVRGRKPRVTPTASRIGDL